MGDLISINQLQFIVMLKPISLLLHSSLFLVLIATFSSIVYYLNNEPPEPRQTPAILQPSASTPAPAPTPTATSRPAPTPSGTATATLPNPDWSSLQPGLERRVIDVYNTQNQPVESLHIWRLDQTSYRLDVAYDETPKSLAAWQEQTGAAIVLNGGYYSVANERYFPDGLTVVDGQAFGRSFAGFGGMLAIEASGAELRWLAEEDRKSVV